MSKSILVTRRGANSLPRPRSRSVGKNILVFDHGAMAHAFRGRRADQRAKTFWQQIDGLPAGRIVYAAFPRVPHHAASRFMLSPNSEFGKRENRFRFRIVLEGRRKLCSLRSGNYPKS